MSRYTAQELSGMTMKALWSHVDAEGLPVKLSRINKSTTKKLLAKKILAAYAAQDLDSAAESLVANDVPQPNADFEKLCDNATSGDDEGDTPKRGGARPGAGRPKGMTEEKALYNRLSEQPHPAVKQVFELLFEAWATKTQCPGVRLTEEEARDIALPWTNVLELMGVADRIPSWIVVAVACGWNTLSIVKAKAQIARDAQATKEPAAVPTQAVGAE